MEKVINLTPYEILVRWDDGRSAAFEPSGAVARVSATPGRPLGMVAGVPVYGPPVWGAVEGLPPHDAAADTVYIVSAMVAARCGDRPDVVSPGTGPGDKAVRDADGRIIAVTRFIASRDPLAEVLR